MTIEELMNRFDDGVAALQRTADALEALEILVRNAQTRYKPTEESTEENK